MNYVTRIVINLKFVPKSSYLVTSISLFFVRFYLFIFFLEKCGQIFFINFCDAYLFVNLKKFILIFIGLLKTISRNDSEKFTIFSQLSAINLQKTDFCE